MEQAKRNADLFFPVVGVLEELSKIVSRWNSSGLTSFSFTDTTLALLEHKLPSFFAGASHLFYDQLKGLISNYLLNTKLNTPLLNLPPLQSRTETATQRNLRSQKVPGRNSAEDLQWKRLKPDIFVLVSALPLLLITNIICRSSTCG